MTPDQMNDDSFLRTRWAQAQDARRDETPRTDHPEATCQECSRPNVTWFAPSELWNRVGRLKDGSDPMLCPTCFISLAESKGVHATAWKVAPERFEKEEAQRLQSKLEIAERRVAELNTVVLQLEAESAEARTRYRARIAELEKFLREETWESTFTRAAVDAAIRAAKTPPRTTGDCERPEDAARRFAIENDSLRNDLAAARLDETPTDPVLTKLGVALASDLGNDLAAAHQRIAQLEADRDEQRDNFHAAATYVQDLESALAELRVREKKLVHELTATSSDLATTRELYYEVIEQRNAFHKRVAELEAERDHWRTEALREMSMPDDERRRAAAFAREQTP